MTQVQLVVTGRCEELALHTSLRSLFPDIEFLRPIKVDSFTSTPVVEPAPAGLVATLDKFTLKLIEHVDASDALVVGVDDLEFNPVVDQVVDAVRRSIARGLDVVRSSAPHRTRLAEKLQRRCSFHLLVPMVEAYFFGDPAALARAGANRPSRFDAVHCDVEAFQVVDEGFTAPPDSDDKRDWCRGGAQRAFHPKRYLKYLSGDGAPGSWSYREAKEGKSALESLAWSEVTGQPTFTRSVRALIEDLADFCGAASPAGPGELVDATGRGAQRAERTLRNI